jgi:2-phosphosulfolactate phosphatase
VTSSTSPTRDRSWFEQSGWNVRFDWGPNGLRTLAPVSDVVVVVDVLRFTTAVDVALGRGAVVYPYRWHDGSEGEFADERDAVVAERSTSTAPGPPWSLSPGSLSSLSSGQGLVLPSPNGSALCFGAATAGARAVFAGCLRNAAAVGSAALRVAGEGGSVAVIAAGERWNETTGPLRPCIEDMLGAGAIAAAMMEAGGVPSPEARVAIAAFDAVRGDLDGVLAECGSGRELRERGMGSDTAWAAAFDVSDVAPRLDGERFIAG